ncbi:MAG: tetratricopeptide repeat protein [Prevotella sp.]|jgi:tetratricopeptide (TPR) repeat protein|nr:tetratricopeptide repeat protein [Prevotella sp.]
MENVIFRKFNLIYLVLTALFLYSCKESNHSTDILAQAQSKMESDPSAALYLLNSIPNPQSMDEEHYMEFIVANVRAKSLTYQSVKNDTLIFKAQKYFNNRNNPAQAAYANYYASSVYYGNGAIYKDMESTMLAKYYALKAGDNVMVAKCFQSIGNTYYEKKILDSALVYYRQASYYYNLTQGQDTQKYTVINFIGQSYYNDGNIDSAYFYFNRGLQGAEQLGRKDLQATFRHMLGRVYRRQKDFQKSSAYLHRALAEVENKEEAGRMNLSLFKLYIDKDQLDSAKYYSTRVKESLPDISYIYSRQGAYLSLTEYYQKSGDYKEAGYYKDSLRSVDRKIHELNNERGLKEAEDRYKSVLQKKEVHNLQIRNRLLILCGVVVLLSILAAFYFMLRNARQKREQEVEKNRLLQKEMDQQYESLSYMQEIYRNIVTEWMEIEKAVRKLTKELGATEEPEIYTRIRNLIDSFKQNTNKEFIKLAKNHLEKQPYGQKAIELLEERELLLFMLYYCGYRRNEVALLLGVNSHINNMKLRKLGLRNKMVEAGMLREEIEEMLFAEDEAKQEEE